MAKLKPNALREVVVDGVQTFVPEASTIGDLVPEEVTAVTTVDGSGASRLIARRDFAQLVPEGFMTHLTAISKGVGGAGSRGGD